MRAGDLEAQPCCWRAVLAVIFLCLSLVRAWDWCGAPGIDMLVIGSAIRCARRRGHDVVKRKISDGFSDDDRILDRDTDGIPGNDIGLSCGEY
jgi:hypothetical protein